jgi:hypothetical protein
MTDKKSACATWYRLVTRLERAARDPVCPVVDVNGGQAGVGRRHHPAAGLIGSMLRPDPVDDPVLRYLGGEFTLPDAQVPQA